MRDENQDSFELFADTLTITLGCILFIALLLVAATRSHQIDKSGLFHFERKSELLHRQIAIAEQSLDHAKENLDQTSRDAPSSNSAIREYELNAQKRLADFYGQTEPHFAEALTSENIRIQGFLAKYPWMKETISETIYSLEERIDRAFAEASKEPIALSVLRQQSTQAPIPIYFLLKEDRLFPAAHPNQVNPHVAWTPNNLSEGQTPSKWSLSPNMEAGFDSTEAWTATRQIIESREMTRESESQIVLLVYEDSFQLARHLISELSISDVNFSWRPLMLHQRVSLSKGGLPPDTPF